MEKLLMSVVRLAVTVAVHRTLIGQAGRHCPIAKCAGIRHPHVSCKELAALLRLHP
jgi:hypothetical protein